MRRLFLVFVLSCAPAEPEFGDPHGIHGKQLPNEPATGGPGGGPFGAAYDPAVGKPATTMKAAHVGKGGPEPGDQIDCFTCHIAEGLAKAKLFSYGGRITKGGAPLADADVLVVSGETKLGPVKSDADGFFWLAGAPIEAGSKAYARLGDTTEAMATPLAAGTAGGSCDSAACHVPGKQNKIFIR